MITPPFWRCFGVRKSAGNSSTAALVQFTASVKKSIDINLSGHTWFYTCFEICLVLLKCLISVYLVLPVLLSFRISSKSVSVVASDDFERVMQTARILYIPVFSVKIYLLNLT